MRALTRLSVVVMCTDPVVRDACACAAAGFGDRACVRSRRPRAARRHGDAGGTEHRLLAHGRVGRDGGLFGAQPDTRHLHVVGRDGRLRRREARGPGLDRRRRDDHRPEAADGGRAGGGHGDGRGAAGRAEQQQDRRQPVGQGDRPGAVELPELHGAHAADSRHDAESRGFVVRRRPGRGQRHPVTGQPLPARRHVQQR